MCKHKSFISKDFVLDQHFAEEAYFDERKNQNHCYHKCAYQLNYMTHDLKSRFFIKEQEKIRQVKRNENRDCEDGYENYTALDNSLSLLVLVAKHWNENDCDFQIVYSKDQMLRMKQENTNCT